VRILAHRGSPTSDTVENSIPAISAALAAGADGVEVDLRLTADGVLAVCHDPDLRRR
jgi:glycerophosphoryl diester phosphodiesterase